MEPQLLGHPAHSHVTIPTELTWERAKTENPKINASIMEDKLINKRVLTQFKNEC
jgi:hypothetical protein